jgi:hypothetical protein
MLILGLSVLTKDFVIVRLEIVTVSKDIQVWLANE